MASKSTNLDQLGTVVSSVTGVNKTQNTTLADHTTKITALETEVANIKKSLAYKVGEVTITDTDIVIGTSNKNITNWVLPLAGTQLYLIFIKNLCTYYGVSALDGTFSIGSIAYDTNTTYNSKWFELSPGRIEVRFGSLGTGIQIINWRHP